MAPTMSNNPTVREKMISLEEFPVLEQDVSLKKALDIMTKDHIGVACFVDSNKHLVGVLTDGDLRRLILTKQNPLPALLVSHALDFGNSNPTTVKATELLSVAREIMDSKRIWDLPVVADSGKLVGLLHRHNVA